MRRRRGVMMVGGRSVRIAPPVAPSILLLDQFTTNAGSPLASPRTCEPGPGTLNLVQNDGTLSIASQKLTLTAQSTPAWNDLGCISANSFTRAAGLALMATMVPGATNTNWGALLWQTGSTLTANPVTAPGAQGLAMEDGTRRIFAMSGGFVLGDLWSLTSNAVAVVLRATGSFLCLDTGSGYKLLWVVTAGAGTPLFPLFQNRDGAATVDDFRVVNLGAPWNDDYGIATQRVAGSVSAGQTFTHTADCLIDWVETTRPSSGDTILFFRKQDASNYWEIRISATGALTLNEIVAGTPTQRATAAGVVASGNRVVIIAEGTTIRGFSADTLRWTYASASNFATATAGELNALGTSAVVNDLIAWPRSVTITG